MPSAPTLRSERSLHASVHFLQRSSFRDLLNLNFYPDRRVITGLFPGPGRPVDASALKLIRQAGAQQRVIDADAGVALERVPPIVLEGVDALVGVELPDRVNPPLPHQF